MPEMQAGLLVQQTEADERMTAITRAQKLKAKRGRPRLPNLARTQSGRISRSSTQTQERKATEEQKAMATVINMRERLHGATGSNAKALEWGYVLGRIWMDGNLGPRSEPTTEPNKPRGLMRIGDFRLEAGNRYAADMATYFGLTGIPFPSVRAQTLFQSGRGYEGDITAERNEIIKDSADWMMALEGVLLKCENGRNVATTVKNICVLDIDEARGWPPHMHAYLRTGLDALVWKYGLQSQGAGK